MDKGNTQQVKMLGIPPFQQRWPWLGGDLQTLRDTFQFDKLPSEQGEVHIIPIPSVSNTNRVT